MADGELRAALRAVASGLIKAVDPALQASFPAEDDPRWRFNLPATPQTHIQHMFTEASDAFGLAVTGLDRHASSADLAVVGHLAEILARARWLLEPSDAGPAPRTRLRPDRGGDHPAAPGERPRRATRAAPVRPGWPARSPTGPPPWKPGSPSSGRTTALRAVRVPKRRKLLQAYLPGGDAELFALLSAADPQAAVAPSALFYREPSARRPALQLPAVPPHPRVLARPGGRALRGHLRRRRARSRARRLGGGRHHGRGQASSPRRGGGPAIPAAAAARPAPRPVREDGPGTAPRPAVRARAGTGPARTR